MLLSLDLYQGFPMLLSAVVVDLKHTLIAAVAQILRLPKLQWPVNLTVNLVVYYTLTVND